MRIKRWGIVKVEPCPDVVKNSLGKSTFGEKVVRVLLVSVAQGANLERFKFLSNALVFFCGQELLLFIHHSSMSNHHVLYVAGSSGLHASTYSETLSTRLLWHMHGPLNLPPDKQVQSKKRSKDF
jgi:hypothetical protein